MRSLAVKLTLAFIFVSLVGTILVAVLVHRSTRRAFDRFILEQARETLITNLEAYYQRNGSWQGLEEILRRANSLPPAGARPEDPPDLRRWWDRYTLVGADRRIVMCRQRENIGSIYDGDDLNTNIALRVNGQVVGWLVEAEGPYLRPPIGPEQAFLVRVNRATLLAALVAAGLALLLGGVLAYSLTRSLRELTDATEQITRGHLGLQVKVRSNDELGALATSFNKMSADLARATKARRQMTADIAHDLRTPLSVIGGYAEALNDGKLPGNAEVYEILHHETQHLSRLVEDLRLLSLADAGELHLELQSVPAHIIVERTAARHTVAAQQKEIQLTWQADSDLPEVLVDVERMMQVMDNLVVNAFRYTPPGGEVRLLARCAPGGVEFQVQDTGSGISPEDAPFVFDRFYRGDRARQDAGESGLGLAIARSIVEAHRGTIALESQPGQGAVFTIFLPKF